MVMMKNLLPNGIRGLMAAGLMAALMSTIEAALNSTATLTAEDIVKRLRPLSLPKIPFLVISNDLRTTADSRAAMVSDTGVRVGRPI